MLRLKIADCYDDGLYVTTSKNGKPIIYEWSDELREAVVLAKAARPIHISPWLFCNVRGECYIEERTGKPEGWKSMWQRFMKRVLKETKVTEPFPEHDMRAKVASDAESLERARITRTHRCASDGASLPTKT
jgi:hypothetical protein